MNADHFIGVRTPAIHKIADKYYRTIKSESVDQRLALCEHLLKTMVYEHRITAFRWARLARKDYVDGHLQVFANWLDAYVDDWIDTVAIACARGNALQDPERNRSHTETVRRVSRWHI